MAKEGTKGRRQEGTEGKQEKAPDVQTGKGFDFSGMMVQVCGPDGAPKAFFPQHVQAIEHAAKGDRGVVRLVVGGSPVAIGYEGLTFEGIVERVAAAWAALVAPATMVEMARGGADVLHAGVAAALTGQVEARVVGLIPEAVRDELAKWADKYKDKE